MELTQDEKNRIYQEEKARLEAQEKLKKEKKPNFGEIIQAIVGILLLSWLAWFLYGIWFGFGK